MNRRVEAIVEEARKLTPGERADLVHRLVVDLDDGPADGTPEEIEAAWVEEVERRIAQAERGEATFSDFDEVMARARARIRQP